MVPNSVHGSTLVSAIYKYKHVGSFAAKRNADIPEAKYRSNESGMALKEVRKIVKSSVADCKTRLNLVRSLSLSRLDVNIAVRCNLSFSSIKMYDRSYHRAYRSALLCRKDNKVEHVTNFVFRQRNHIPSLYANRMCVRLRYMCRLLRHAPVSLLALLQHELELLGENFWLYQIFDDILYVQKYNACLDSYPSPHSDMADWFSLMRDLPTAFLRCVDNATSRRKIQ